MDLINYMAQDVTLPLGAYLGFGGLVLILVIFILASLDSNDDLLIGEDD